MELTGQIFGILGMLVSILSFQCKRNSRVFLMLGASSVLFAISYVFLGSPLSAVCNIINIVRATFAMNEKCHTKWHWLIVSLLYVIGTYFTYDGWWSFVLLATQITGAYAMYFGDGTFLRKIQLFIISPVWFTTNIIAVDQIAVGGIICEVFTVISVIVSFVRYRKTGFEK